jgi:Lon protease-like protein
VQVPLFPLNTVLFPGGPLPLRIFEPRYLTMVGDCLKTDSPFGVLLIRDGHEAGSATTHEVGTLARITDWYQGSDGLLGVTAVGLQRFRVISSFREANGLNVGNIEILPDEPSAQIPDEFQSIPNILAGVLDDLGRLYESLDRRMDDASWVTSRFVEILPIDLEQKQRYLERSDPVDRLRIVQELLDAARLPATGD